MSLGQTICLLRKERNLSQDNLAELLEVSRQSVSKWETDASIPELDKLIRLSEIFQISLDELVGKQPAPAPQKKPAASQSFPTQKVIGIFLLCTGTLLMLLLIVLLMITSPHSWPALLLCIPIWLCGAICLSFRRRAGLWCAWVVYLLGCLVIPPATGQSFLLASLINLRLAGLFSLFWSIAPGLLYVFTAYSFRKTDRFPGKQCWLGAAISGFVFALTCCLPLLQKYAQKMYSPTGAATRVTAYGFLSLINVVQAISLGILVTTLTIAFYRKRQ